MLVLSRKCRESVVIGSEITVTVLEVRGDRVKLGFRAPGEVAIHRAEVKERIESESSTSVRDSLSRGTELVCSKLQGAAV